MAIMPNWAIGKHITSVLLTPQVVTSTGTLAGTLTDTTPTREFFGHLQDITVEINESFENISSMDRPYENNVPIESSATVRFTEYEKYATTNLAAAAAFGALYWKYVVARGAQTFTGYGVLANYTMDATKQKVLAKMELKAIDPGGTLAIVYG